ncbi:uncharacterized protein BDW43DRAFT_303355 [Aspergillus alliaceus]|uniref:uncharacterized protein n=1 Tax=Petromyces alliaceus TaxID=209559 RepID=UPI0012A5D1FF|nr:uncharacterized protein BDW43DRAFT_303355 [Aspergillus alliaceus]KAB8229242.1 hypothetical protein BDW43DRAFT_303355 [Aspergillus alliaceus]
MYKSEVPLYRDLVDFVWKADAEAINASQKQGSPTIDPNDILPSRNRVERHGAIRLGTAYELSTIRRMFAIMGMFPVGYYDLRAVGFPMHATTFRPGTKEALSKNPFRVFTTVLRMELLTEKARDLAQRALRQRNIFTNRLIALIELAEKQDGLSSAECKEFIVEGLETFRWHSKATVTVEEYQILKAEHPLIADVVSFPSCHINLLAPQTIDIDLVQKMMQDNGMPAKERIEGPTRRQFPILLRQTSFKALEETVYFRDAHDAYDFPDDIAELRSQQLAYFCHRLTSHDQRSLDSKDELEGRSMTLAQLLETNIIEYDSIIYEDYLPLSAGGIFNSNLGSTSQSEQLVMEADEVLDGFQRKLGTSIIDEFHLYTHMQQDSLENCRKQLGLEVILH